MENMTKVVITKEKLDALANSVACKSGVPVQMSVDQMKSAVDSIQLPISEYYLWQDENGYIRTSKTMPETQVSGSILKFPGWLMRLGIMEKLVVVDETEAELEVSTSIIQKLEEVSDE